MLNYDKIQNVANFLYEMYFKGRSKEELTDSKVCQCVDDMCKYQKCTEEECEKIKNLIYEWIAITSERGTVLVDDTEQDLPWYMDKIRLSRENGDENFWPRYKRYLFKDKHFPPSVITELGDETLEQNIMDRLLNPDINNRNRKFNKGLVIGDVQSGKTSTYIGLMCKAADVGYRVFIILTGTIESLRRQTQERIEEGFTGIDMTSGTNVRVGVGRDGGKILAQTITSRLADFTGDKNTISIPFENKSSGIVVFVVKKQSKVLKKLKSWVLKVNGRNPGEKIENCPCLIIDDEADNASINTGKNKDKPTTINKLIREIADEFTISNYVGFTATPYANVFIDPNTTEEMETQDLFPENFIVTLPRSSNYMGPHNLFLLDGKYYHQLIYIKDAGHDVDDGFDFSYKHSKEWEGELPESLTDAIYSFYIVNAIRDIRGEEKEHRSMLVNMSRFVNVQKYIKSCVERIHNDACISISHNYNSNNDILLRDDVWKRLYTIWEKNFSNIKLNKKCEKIISWDDVAHSMFNAIENIKIKVVNSSKESEKLVYMKENPMRVIAIGGLALSRGLTLEGLVISYFFRNTCTYDVLMQMGRWFGYRESYADLVRIWTDEQSVDWYAEITHATEQLKQDVGDMNAKNLKPLDFGIKVFNISKKLHITSPIKMRHAVEKWIEQSYFGKITESAYLSINTDDLKSNYDNFKKFMLENESSGRYIERISERGLYSEVAIMKNADLSRTIDFISKIKVHEGNNKFNIDTIVKFMCKYKKYIRNFDIVFVEGKKKLGDNTFVEVCGEKLIKVVRRNCSIKESVGRLDIGNRGRVGGTSDGYVGLTKNEYSEAVRLYNEDNETDDETADQSAENKAYAADIWFKYVEDRNPVLFIYFVDVKNDKQQDKFNQLSKELGETPIMAFGLGIPSNSAVPVGEELRAFVNPSCKEGSACVRDCSESKEV